MTARPRRLGAAWERRARGFLVDRGLEVIAENFHSRFGEIDLVMRDGNALVFVEIKYRRHRALARAIETITPAKQRRLIRTAEYFLLRQPAWRSRPMRFDVIAIEPQPAAGAAVLQDDAAEIRWLKNAFQLD